MNKPFQIAIILALCWTLFFVYPVRSVTNHLKNETKDATERIHGFAVIRESEESTNEFSTKHPMGKDIDRFG